MEDDSVDRLNEVLAIVGQSFAELQRETETTDDEIRYDSWSEEVSRDDPSSYRPETPLRTMNIQEE